MVSGEWAIGSKHGSRGMHQEIVGRIQGADNTSWNGRGQFGEALKGKGTLEWLRDCDNFFFYEQNKPLTLPSLSKLN